ncbi:MAG: hypothetical protein JST04_03970 [Bdellovibrionales bacterium]|nr:hypothetical protein [Bdellovibrionales bacterium]
MKHRPFSITAALVRLASATALALAFAGCENGIKVIGSETSDSATVDPISATFHLRNTRAGLELKVNQGEAGSVYYAVYDADPGTLTASAVKAAALGSLGGSLVAGGTLAVGSAGVDTTENVNTLADKQLYTVFAVAEGTSGLDTDAHVKKYSKVLPKGMTQLSFSKVTGASAGTLVRYAAAVPQDYYYNPTKDYPILIWIHGNGESANDASNAETNFTNVAGFLGPFKRLNNDLNDIPMVVIAAQCNYAFFSCANQSDASLHKEAYDDAITKFRTDSKRVYVAGISYGGQGTVRFASTYPTLVSAAVATATDQAGFSDAALCASLGANNVAMWVLNDENDSVFGHAGMESMVSNLRSCASYTNALAKPRITVFSPVSWPNTIESHGSVENLSFRLPFWNGSAWRYWDGAAEQNDTNPPTHPAEFGLELASATPGNTPAPTVIAQDSLVTVGTAHGVTLTSLYDYLLLFSKP